MRAGRRILNALCLAAVLHGAGLSAAAGSAPADAPPDLPSVDKPPLGPGVFLIANRNLRDPNFGHAVVLITHYDQSGTAGLIVNRRLQLSATEVVPALGSLNVDAGELHMGGPVAPASLQFLVRVEAGVAEAAPVFSDVYLITSKEMLSSLLSGGIAGSALRLYAGYAGWAAGQLESELLRGDWYLMRAERRYVFSDRPNSVWPELIERVAARWALADCHRALYGMAYRSLLYNTQKIVPIPAALDWQGSQGDVVLVVPPRC